MTVRGIFGFGAGLWMGLSSGAYTFVSSPFRSNENALRLNFPSGAAQYISFQAPNADGSDGVDFNEATIWYLFKMHVTTLPASGSRQIVNVTGAILASKLSLWVDSAGHLIVKNSAGTTVLTSTTLVSAGNNYYIGGKVGTSGTVGAWELYIGGALEGSGTTNTLTSNTGGFFFGDGTSTGAPAADFTFGELIIANAAFAGCGVAGFSDVISLRPRAAGSQTTGWAGGTGSTFAEVSEVAYDSDTTYLKSTVSGDRRTFLVDSHTTRGISASSYLGVSVAAVIRKESGTSGIIATLRSGSTNSDNSGRNENTTYSINTRLVVNDPNTSAAWTDSGIDAVEIGVATNAAAPSRCTTLCLEVAFVVGSTTYTKSFSRAGAMTLAFSRSLGAVRTSSRSGAQTMAVSRATSTYKRTSSRTGSIAETFNRVAAKVRPLARAGAMTLAFSRAGSTYKRPSSRAGTIAETFARSKGAKRAISRAGTIAEAFSRAGSTYKRTSSRTGSIAETFATVKVKPVAFSRVGSIAEVFKRVASYKRTSSRTGSIAETFARVATYKRAISRAAGASYASTILATAGLIAYWRLGDASSPAVDSVGGFNGAASGSPTFGTTGILPNGDTNKAVSFAAASSQYLDITYAAGLNVGDVFSIEAWLKPTSVSAYQTILDQGGNGSSSYFFGISNTGHLELWKGSGGAAISSSTSTISAGAVVHVAVTKNGASVHLYINGVDVSGAVTNLTIVNSATNLRIGGRAGVSQFFNGVIDEVALYNVALASSDVLGHYNAGNSTAGGLVAAFARKLIANRTSSRAGAMTLAFKRVATYKRALTRAGTIAETFVRVLTSRRTSSRSGTIAETFKRVATYKRTSSRAGTIAETFRRALIAKRSSSRAGAQVMSLSRKEIAVRAFARVGSIAETFKRSLAIRRSISRVGTFASSFSFNRIVIIVARPSGIEGGATGFSIFGRSLVVKIRGGKASQDIEGKQ